MLAMMAEEAKVIVLVVLFGLSFLTAIVAMLIRHQQVMARTIHQSRDSERDELRDAQIASLTASVAELQDRLNRQMIEQDVTRRLNGS